MAFHKFFFPSLRDSEGSSVKSTFKMSPTAAKVKTSRWLSAFSVISLFLLLVTSTYAEPDAESASSPSLELTTQFSQNGVRGSVTFHEATTGEVKGKVIITLRLKVAEEYTGEYSWGIYEFPIDYSKKDYCDSRMLGRRPIVNFDEILGKLVLPRPVPENATEPVDDVIEFATDAVALLGKDSIWGRSLVLEGPSKARVCATITPNSNTPTKTAEARFVSPIAGSVWFTTVSKGDAVETKIFTNLFHVQATTSSRHLWQIFITDIFDSDLDVHGSDCDFLQILYNPGNKDGEGCSEEDPAKCKDGDLGSKFGKIRVGKRESMFTKNYHTDLSLEMPELNGPRSLFLVIFDEEVPDAFLGCAKIREVPVKKAKATFMSEGVTGDIHFSQASQFQPVTSFINLEGLQEGAGGFHVHEFPVPSRMNEDDTPCSRTSGHFNPFNVDNSGSPAPGLGSFDKYEVGDLSGKYGTLKGQKKVAGRFVDPNLSLFGPLSIVGRSIVIHKTPVPKRWVCSTIDLDRPLITAVAQFTYPIAGRIIFRQEAENPFADTSIFVESLLYSDGSKNDTRDHKWHVHVNVPGRDYFNWTGRCLSAGGHYNPYQVSLEDVLYNECINEHIPLRCELGDLSNKHKTLYVAGRKKDIKNTVKYFTDSNLPLSGSSSIIGHSITIHDDKAPEHRGTRMACTGILRSFRHKAVARNWFGNGVTPPPVSGRLEFIQDTDRSLTHTLVAIHGMKGDANAYHVHDIPVQDHLEFPCTGDAVGGHFNPYNFDASDSPKPSTGTPDQYEMGDLSGKYGLVANMNEVREVYNDTNLSLYGLNSIVGRSIVVHKKRKGQRWACASIGWGFDPDEAREVRAIASFHHPGGFAWGYIRFRQVVYHDGSKSDTTIEVRLKYPGKTNKDFTSGHKWSVYVNPVGHDASVKFQNARCTAAGYRWNPTHIQLAAPMDHALYAEECGGDYPLRCEVGDLSGRHGPISVGGKAYVVNDVNLPLSGDWYNSAVGKSIIIHNPDGSSDRMACANIKEEKDIIKYATVQTKARFNLATFIEEVQAVMGIPEWFLFVDSRNTKRLYNGKCVQIQLHFTGPYANRLEQDFGRLLRTGKLESPSIQIPGYFAAANRKSKLGYRECGSEKPSTSSSSFNDLYSSLTGGGGGGSSGGSSVKVSSFTFIVFPSLLLLLWQR